MYQVQYLLDPPQPFKVVGLLLLTTWTQQGSISVKALTQQVAYQLSWGKTQEFQKSIQVEPLHCIKGAKPKFSIPLVSQRGTINTLMEIIEKVVQPAFPLEYRCSDISLSPEPPELRKKAYERKATKISGH